MNRTRSRSPRIKIDHPAGQRVEIVIDRQLREALDLLRSQLATRPATTPAG